MTIKLVFCRKPRCGGPNDDYSRPCSNNDTNCGKWINYWWYPNHCYIQDITSNMARKCLGNRTLAFIGDSMIRDTGFGVVSLLLGNDSVKDAPHFKYDKGDRQPKAKHKGGGIGARYGSRIPNFEHWKNNVPSPNFNGFVYPKQYVSSRSNIDMSSSIGGSTGYGNTNLDDISSKLVHFNLDDGGSSHIGDNYDTHNNRKTHDKFGITDIEGSWQVQIWNLFRNEFQFGNQVDDVIANRLVGFHSYEDDCGTNCNNNNNNNNNKGYESHERKEKKDGVVLRQIDLAFLQHALHDQGWWQQQPHGPRLYDTVLKNWRENLVKIPSSSRSRSSNNHNHGNKYKYKYTNLDGRRNDDLGSSSESQSTKEIRKLKDGVDKISSIQSSTRKRKHKQSNSNSIISPAPPAPSVWVSMNPNCPSMVGKVGAVYSDLDGPAQAYMIEDANHYLNIRFKKERLPYWDAGALLRIGSGDAGMEKRRKYSADGVHVRMYVDLMRAKLLFNHLCDEDMTWRGDIEVFM